MTIIITGDLHLREAEEDRLKVLEWLCIQARKEGADLVLIAGDLFENSSDFMELKNIVRRIFDRELEKIPSVIIPGNHDQFLEGSHYLGSGVSVLSSPGDSKTFKDGNSQVNVIGVPYMKGEIMTSFIDELKFKEQATNVLLTHGSLIDPSHRYIQEKINEEGEENSFFIFTEDFDTSPVDAVLLGHWHGDDNFKYGDTHFCYPGAPLPTSRRELGKKHYYIMKTESGRITDLKRKLIDAPDSWFFEKKSIFLSPNFESQTINDLRAFFEGAEKGNSDCHLLLEVNGYVTLSEMKIRGEINEILNEGADKYRDISPEFNFKPAESLKNPLVERFIEKVNNLQLQDTEITELLSDDESTLQRRFSRLMEENEREIKRRILEGALESFSDRLD